MIFWLKSFVFIEPNLVLCRQQTLSKNKRPVTRVILGVVEVRFCSLHSVLHNQCGIWENGQCLWVMFFSQSKLTTSHAQTFKCVKVVCVITVKYQNFNYNFLPVWDPIKYIHNSLPKNKHEFNLYLKYRVKYASYCMFSFFNNDLKIIMYDKKLTNVLKGNQM